MSEDKTKVSRQQLSAILTQVESALKEIQSLKEEVKSHA
jgi:hypothetical protein